MGSIINLQGRTITVFESKINSLKIVHEVIFDRIELGTYMIASALMVKKNINYKRIL